MKIWGERKDGERRGVSNKPIYHTDDSTAEWCCIQLNPRILRPHLLI